MVSKYIGETEKNLKRLFDAAEASGAVLLFDEADALFGKRSEVKDSHDRYANIEVAYLLQRVEAYRGLAVLTTNMKSALDQAFLRRIRFIVSFPFPDAASREQIWRRQFPAGRPVGRGRFHGAGPAQPARRQHPQHRRQCRLQGRRCRHPHRTVAAGDGRARRIRQARTLDGQRGDGRHGMKLGGLDVRIRRLVVDAEHRALAAGLSDDIGRALQAELTAPSTSRPSVDGSNIGATIAARIAQRLTKQSGGAA